MMPFVGEIRLFAGNFAPQGWAMCDGRILPIAEFDALFNLIGAKYGGDGSNTFALPDLRDSVAIHRGPGNAVGAKGSGPMGLTKSAVPLNYIISLFGQYPMR